MIKNIIKSLIVCLIIVGLYYYVALPPLNIHSAEFYAFLFVAYLAFMIPLSLFEYGKFFDGKTISNKIKVSKVYKYSWFYCT